MPLKEKMCSHQQVFKRQLSPILKTYNFMISFIQNAKGCQNGIPWIVNQEEM